MLVLGNAFVVLSGININTYVGLLTTGIQLKPEVYCIKK